MKNKTQGLVLRTSVYKDKDALVKVLTEDGVMTLYARGVYKANAKNLRIVQPFSYNEFMLEQKKSMPLLLQGTPIHFYYSIQQDLLKSSVCFVIHDCIQKIKVPHELFEIVLEVWNSADKNLDDFYFWCVIALKYCIESDGIQPYVDGCVHCQNSKVETISLKDGGFLCPSCNHGRYLKWNIKDLQKMRALFRCKFQDLSILRDTFSFALEDFIYLAKWMDYHAQKNLSSIQFLEAIRYL